MLKNKKDQNYDDFRSSQIWFMVNINRDYHKARTKVPEDLFNKLQSHMRQMYEEGTPMAWIAKLYEYDKAHVSRIIRGIPNN